MGQRALILTLVLVALLLRAWDFPRHGEMRHMDEMGYIPGSLQLLEGIIPSTKYAPAGPQTWIGWLYAGAQSAKYVVRPTAEERAVDVRVRPFVAVNHALWNNYTDLTALRDVAWILPTMLATAWAVVEAFRFGKAKSGVAGGILIAGLVAVFPLLVQISNDGRPYALSWVLGITGVCIAWRRKDWPGRTLSAIALGLAIGSRVDMLMMLPLVWSELWAERREQSWWRAFLRYNLIAVVTALLVAPWILTNLIGNLRIIVTVRLAQPAMGPTPLSVTFRDLFFTQGLWAVVLLAVIGAVLPRKGERFPRVFLAIYSLALIASIFKATMGGLYHQGGPLVLTILLCPLGLAAFDRFGRHATCVVAGIALLLPAVQDIRLTRARHRAFVSDDAAIAWIEQHVPSGTQLITGSHIHNLLPTQEASDRLWAEVNDNNAWEKKFLAGLERFKLPRTAIPRALSDENMMVERGNKAEFERTGGVLLWRGPSADPAIQGMTPNVMWTSPDGQNATWLFAAPNVKLNGGSLALGSQR